MAKQVPDTRNVGKDAMKEDGTINRAALPAIFNPEDLNAFRTSPPLERCLSGTTVTLVDNGARGLLQKLFVKVYYRGADDGYLLTRTVHLPAPTLWQTS